MEIVRKRIKHIYFRIYHTQKKIIVSAPVGIKSDALNSAIASKRAWIKKQALKQSQRTLLIENEFPYGKNLMFKGEKRSVLTRDTQRRPKILIGSAGEIHVYAKPDTSTEKLNSLIDRWYRKELIFSIKYFVEKWGLTLGVNVKEYRIKKMRTRWGSCNTKAGRIWLNAALIKLDSKFLEYVVVHEMVHLLERSHNARFYQLMDRYIPDWAELKQQLNLVTL